MNKESTHLVVRCHKCRRAEDEDGNPVIVADQRHTIMDRLEAKFNQRGWLLHAKCPDCGG